VFGDNQIMSIQVRSFSASTRKLRGGYFRESKPANFPEDIVVERQYYAVGVGPAVFGGDQCDQADRLQVSEIGVIIDM
jgi:hypothetical protein